MTTTYGEYKDKDSEMTDCPICLMPLMPDDEILILSCEVKHYFHKQCGTEWLRMKAECPLCRKNFAAEINQVEQDDR